MRRQFWEIIDQPWCPKFLRDGVRDYLRLISSLGHPYRGIFPHLKGAIEASGTDRVVDLGSGTGGPWLALKPRIEREYDLDLKVTLTDLFPKPLADLFAASSLEEKGIRYHPEPVDARTVPAVLTGFRTLFASFHHFPPEQARSILADAVAQHQGIAVFEMTQRSLLAILLMILTPFMAFWVTPFIRPLSWKRLIFTYLIPVIPIVLAFDGVVSCLRTYTPDELLRMAAQVSDSEYHWEARYCRAFPPSPVPVTLLIGYPDSIGNRGPDTE